MSLDDFGPPHPLLEAKFKQFMDAYELSSDGKTTSSASKVSAGKSQSVGPTSALKQEMAFWEREWRRRKTDRTRLELLAEMQTAVSRLRFAPDVSTRRGTLEWRMKIAEDERAPEVVMATYDIGKTTYYKIRADLIPHRPPRRVKFP